MDEGMEASSYSSKIVILQAQAKASRVKHGPAQVPKRPPSCLSCMSSKVKCDREVPCARCVRLRLTCVPNPRLPGRPLKRQGSSSSSPITTSSSFSAAAAAPPPPPPPEKVAKRSISSTPSSSASLPLGGSTSNHRHPPSILASSGVKVELGGGGGGGGGGVTTAAAAAKGAQQQHQQQLHTRPLPSSSSFAPLSIPPSEKSGGVGNNKISEGRRNTTTSATPSSSNVIPSSTVHTKTSASAQLYGKRGDDESTRKSTGGEAGSSSSSSSTISPTSLSPSFILSFISLFSAGKVVSLRTRSILHNWYLWNKEQGEKDATDDLLHPISYILGIDPSQSPLPKPSSPPTTSRPSSSSSSSAAPNAGYGYTGVSSSEEYAAVRPASGSGQLVESGEESKEGIKIKRTWPRPLKPELDEGRAQLALNSLATVAASVLSASTVSSASAVSSLPRATTTTTMALTSLEAAVSDTSFLTTAPIPAEMKKFLNGDSNGDSSPVCGMIWMKGKSKPELLCNESFSTMLIPKQKVQERLIHEGVHIEQIWQSIITCETLHLFYEALAEATFCSPDAFGVTSRIIRVIDQWGSQVSALASIAVFVTPCGTCSAQAIRLIPLLQVDPTTPSVNPKPFSPTLSQEYHHQQHKAAAFNPHHYSLPHLSNYYQHQAQQLLTSRLPPSVASQKQHHHSSRQLNGAVYHHHQHPHPHEHYAHQREGDQRWRV